MSDPMKCDLADEITKWYEEHPGERMFPEQPSDVGSTSAHDPDGQDATPAGGYVCDNPEVDWIADQEEQADARGDG